jgi:hypothetical protein
MAKWSKDFKEALGPDYEKLEDADDWLYMAVGNAYKELGHVQESTTEYDMFFLGYDENPKYSISLADLVLFAENVESETIKTFMELHGVDDGFIEYLKYLKCVVVKDSIELPNLE